MNIKIIIKYAPDTLLCILSATFLILATPGYDLCPLAFIAVAIAMHIYERKILNFTLAIFIIGFLFYLVAARWIYIPMVYFGNAPMWGGVVFVVFVALIAALCTWAPAGYVLQRTNNHLLMALTLIALEMIKSQYIFKGLPWLNLAQTQSSNLILLQSVSAVGEYGLSFIVLICGMLLYYAIKNRQKQHLAMLGTISLTVVVYGLLSLYIFTPNVTKENTYTARVIQTGINQSDKWVYSKHEQIHETIVDAIIKAVEKDQEYDFLLLPETTFLVDPLRDYKLTALLQYASKNKPLLIGYDKTLYNHQTKEPIYRNSLGYFKDGLLVDEYDKIHLAPFGEYFPLERQLYPIREFFFGSGPLYSSGSDQSVFTIGDKINVAPLICFEGAFTDLWRARIAKGANVIALVSNDAWFGKSTGRKQHLTVDRIRAIEYGTSMIRLTQDGISTLIDPQGRVLYTLPENVMAIEDIQFSTATKATIFYKTQNLWYVIILIYCGSKIFQKRRKNR